jgi:hypothetical protein
MRRGDPVKDYLTRRGVSAPLANASLDELVERWRKIVDEIADGYALGLDDYLNDLDLRQILHELERELPQAWNAEARRQLHAIDARCRAHLAPRRSCLWGKELARERGWTARANWWYFSRPLHPGDELARDLERANRR